MYKKRNIEFNIIKKLIKENIYLAKCGFFGSRNILGDKMINLYNGKYFVLDICYDYSYFELFGSTEDEFQDLLYFYSSLGGI